MTSHATPGPRPCTLSIYPAYPHVHLSAFELRLVQPPPSLEPFSRRNRAPAPPPLLSSSCPPHHRHPHHVPSPSIDNRLEPQNHRAPVRVTLFLVAPSFPVTLSSTYPQSLPSASTPHGIIRPSGLFTVYHPIPIPIVIRQLLLFSLSGLLLYRLVSCASCSFSYLWLRIVIGYYLLYRCCIFIYIYGRFPHIYQGMSCTVFLDASPSQCYRCLFVVPVLPA